MKKILLLTVLACGLASAFDKTGAPSDWFVRGDATGNLLMIDMSNVTAVNGVATPWTDPQTGNTIAMRVWLRGGGYVDLGVDLAKAFAQQFGQWLAKPRDQVPCTDCLVGDVRTNGLRWTCTPVRSLTMRCYIDLASAACPKGTVCLTGTTWTVGR